MNPTLLSHLVHFLKNEKVDYSLYEEQINLDSATEGAKQHGIALSETTPTLILKAKDRYFAAIICGNTRISFKKLKQALNKKDIRLADPETVSHMTGSKVGEVSLINSGLATLI